MTNQHYPVHLSIASSAEIEHTACQLKVTREEFLATGILPQHPPRPMILESWRRCCAMQVNPSRRYAPLAVTHEVQLCHLREASQLLMRAARPVMSHLCDFLADSGYVIVLSDADGCLLEVIGDTGTRRCLARIDFVPGGDWSEGAAGTNALGTALADGHVVQLLSVSLLLLTRQRPSRMPGSLPPFSSTLITWKPCVKLIGSRADSSLLFHMTCNHR